MSAHARETGAALPARRAFYLGRIEQLARRGALSGRPGPWLDVARRAAEADEDDEDDAEGSTCDVALHAVYLELDLWGQVCRTQVLPEHRSELGAAIRRIANEKMPDPSDLNRLPLWLVSLEPSAGAPLSAVDPTAPTLDELVLIRQLKEAANHLTVAALESALRSALLLTQGAGVDPTHATCESWEILSMQEIFVQALAEAMPYPYRRVLAAYAQFAFFDLYAPDEPKPEFLTQVPRGVGKGEDVWFFYPMWASIVAGHTKVLTPDRVGTPWLVVSLERLVDRWEEQEAAQAKRSAGHLRQLVLSATSGRTG